MKATVHPNYRDCILNISNSLLKHYGAKTFYGGQVELDEILARRFRHIAVFLIDGMGSRIIDRHLSVKSFLRRHRIKDITTVCPSTTSAATTAFLSGTSPLRNGWFGWQQYFERYNRHVILFKNEDYYTGEPLNINIAKDDLPYESILSMIEKASKDTKAYTSIFEEQKRKFMRLGELCRLVKRNFRKDEKNFTYAYYTELDSLMHEVGPEHRRVRRLLRKIDRNLARVHRAMGDDSLVIVIADHGQIAVEEMNLCEHPDLLKTISGKPSLEGRFTSLNVIDEEAFLRYYGEHLNPYFDLYTKAEIIKKHFFGPEDETAYASFLGNYFLVAKDRYIITYHDGPMNIHKGHHAGLTEEEMLIPLIAF